MLQVARVRNALAFATHQFFKEKGFVWVASPIITASDCEGAGEQFCVTTLVLHLLLVTIAQFHFFLFFSISYLISCFYKFAGLCEICWRTLR
jgi:aspartyl/asparaginyl-tRNA synthetase